MASDKVTLRDVFENISQLREEIREQYATKEEVKPLKQIVYGGISLVLLTVVGALLAQVVRASGL